MASVRKVKGGYRCFVARKGVRKNKLFKSKRDAADWGAREENLILNAEPEASSVLFGDVLLRYAKEVSAAKRGARWEMLRLERIRTDQIAKIKMADLTPLDFASWRDRRLAEVSPGSVRREMVLLSSVMTASRRDWGLIKASVLADVRKPSSPEPRDRLASPEEMERLAFSAGDDLTKTTARAFHAFLFSVETAMRAGEVCAIKWENIDLEAQTARLLHTKNGHPRDVPLSLEAVRLLRALPDADPAFGMKTSQLDALWRKLRDRADVKDLRYHDSRHMAITQLASKLEILPLARAVGHKDIKQLMAYYNKSASDLAKLLD